MKAALVSATSLAALLAFEVGLDVAIDAHPASAAASFTAAPTSIGFGYVLLNTPQTSFVTASNVSAIANPVTFQTVTLSAFSATQSIVTLSGNAGTSASASHAYMFNPTVTSPTLATSLPSLTTITATLSGTHSATEKLVELTGAGVAPVQSTTVSAFTAVRIGTTATMAAITVSNVGDGDLMPGYKTIAGTTLQGSIGAPSGSVFTGAGGGVTLADLHNTTGASTSAAFTYQYAPTLHTTSDNATVVAAFTNGSSAGTNAAQTVSLTLTGTGVGPVFKGVYNGTTYANTTAIGTAVNNAGNIALGTQKHGATTTFTVTLSNATTDTASTLTNLTLKGFSLGTCVVTGCVYDGFSVLSFPTGAIAEGNSVTVTLDFSGGLATYYDADLSFNTDQGAPGGVGAAGAVFSYLLTANIPEPATIVTFGMGLAGLGWARRRRAARRSAVGTNASPA
jgi:hypothetical protein